MLNPIAGLIFNYLPTGKSYDEIVENIIIACGKNTTKPDVIKKDLEKTVKEFINLKILEPIKGQSDETNDTLIISEHEMTSLSIPYLAPQIKAYTLEELSKKTRNINEKKVGGNKNSSAIVVNFLDTWKPTARNVTFPDTWTPGNGKVSFSDTWNPTKIKPELIDKTKLKIPKLIVKEIKGKK